MQAVLKTGSSMSGGRVCLDVAKRGFVNSPFSHEAKNGKPENDGCPIPLSCGIALEPEQAMHASKVSMFLCFQGIEGA